MCVRRRTARACNNKHNLPTRQAELLCSVSSRAHGAPSARVASSSAVAGTGKQLCASHLSSSSQHHVDRRCSRAEKFSKIRFSVRSRGRRAHRAARPAAAPRTRAHLVEQISSLIHRRDRLRRMRQSLRRGCAFCRDVTRHGQGYPSQLALRLFRTNLFLDRLVLFCD